MSVFHKNSCQLFQAGSSCWLWQKKRPLPELSALTRGELEGVVLILLQQLEALESKVTKSSRNSSQPPSSDGLHKTNSLREPSGNKPGARSGHKGNTLKRTDESTETIDHPLPHQCTLCHSILQLAQAEVAERHQVIDVPANAFDVVEHRTLAVTCGCGQIHVSSVPSGVTELVQYGRNVRALVVHLTQGQILPYTRAAELIVDVYGLKVSPATLLVWVTEASEALQTTADQIAKQLCAAPVLNADESGLRVVGKLHWLHITASDTLTWYGVHAKRGLAVIEAHGILPRRLVVLVHDCWAPYWRPGDSIHALCNAHRLRELGYVTELTSQQWPASMMQLLLGANNARSMPTIWPPSAPGTTRWCGKAKRCILKPRNRRASASSAPRPCRSPTTLASAPHAYPRSSNRSREVSAPSPAPSTSASSAPVSTRCASKDTACSPSCNAPLPAILSRPPLSL